MRVGLTVTARPNLRARFEPLGDAGVDARLREAALEAEARAKRKAPVDTGRLRATIRSARVKPGVHAVIADAKYAAFVEFGTLLRGRRSPQPGGVPPEYRFGTPPGRGPGAGQLRAWAKRVLGDADAAAAVAESVRRFGVRARPYLRPAALEVKRLLRQPRRWRLDPR